MASVKCIIAAGGGRETRVRKAKSDALAKHLIEAKIGLDESSKRIDKKSAGNVKKNKTRGKGSIEDKKCDICDSIAKGTNIFKLHECLQPFHKQCVNKRTSTEEFALIKKGNVNFNCEKCITSRKGIIPLKALDMKLDSSTIEVADDITTFQIVKKVVESVSDKKEDKKEDIAVTGNTNKNLEDNINILSKENEELKSNLEKRTSEESYEKMKKELDTLEKENAQKLDSDNRYQDVIKEREKCREK